MAESNMRVFVSYRRDDEPFATDRLTQALRERLGRDNVFIDIDSIEIGADFVDAIDDWVARCDVLLAVIGHEWLDAQRPDGGRRIDDAGDFVRLEIEAALKRKLPIVPVLIHGTTAPTPTELPPSVAPIMRRNAVELTRKYWDQDVAGLVTALEKGPVEHVGSKLGDHDGHRRQWRWLLSIPIVVALAVLLFVVLLSPSQSNASVAENWLKTIDTGNYVKAASYWHAPGFWTGLKGKTTFLETPAAILTQVQLNGKCHKRIQAIVVDDKDHTVRLRVYIDHPLPGHMCNSAGKSWDEDYLIQDGHITSLRFRLLPGGTASTQTPPSQTESTTTASSTGSTGPSPSVGSGAAGSGPGSSQASPASSGSIATQQAATPTPTTPSSAASTTAGTVPMPPTSTTP
jgi:hypothetical protein